MLGISFPSTPGLRVQMLLFTSERGVRKLTLTLFSWYAFVLANRCACCALLTVGSSCDRIFDARDDLDKFSCFKSCDGLNSFRTVLIASSIYDGCICCAKTL